jgi:hypothetical protein
MVREIVHTGGLKKFIHSNSKKIERGRKPKFKIFSLKINLRNILFKPLEKVHIELRKVDFDFFDTIVSKKGKRSKLKSKIFQSITSDEGIAAFKEIREGVYVVRLTKKSSIFEKIIEIHSNSIKKIYAPIVFPFLKINKKINNEEIRIILDKIRSDLNYCSFCDGKYEGFADRFKCGYCGKYSCLDHHLPEDHKCRGLKK